MIDAIKRAASELGKLFTDDGHWPVSKLIMFALVLGLLWRWASQEGFVSLAEVEVAIGLAFGCYLAMLQFNRRARQGTRAAGTGSTSTPP